MKRDKVWVCRGCCCGTRSRHPGVDAGALEKQLRKDAKRAGARYEVTDCLGPCGQGNVVVVRVQGEYRWFRKANDARTTEAVLQTLVAPHETPDALAGHLMRKRTKKPRP